MPRWLKITLITAAVIFGLLLSSMLIVPWQIKKQGSQWIAANTDRTLTIEEAFFNPFTLTVELNKTKLSEAGDDRPFVSFSHLLISGSIKSIFKKALILDRFELDQPYVNIEFLGDRQFNFSDFTKLGDTSPETQKKGQKKDEAPFHFSFNNIIIRNGQVDFADLSMASQPRHKIRQLELQIPVLGNIPTLINHYVQPALAMRLNGAPFHAEGKTKPFHNSLETNLSLSLEGADLAYYAARSPVPLPIEVKQGALDCDLTLSYRIVAQQKPELLIGGEVTFSDLDLRELDGREIVKIPALNLKLKKGNPFTKEFELSAVEISAPQFYVNRDRAGQWVYQRVMSAQKIEEVKEKRAEQGALLRLKIGKLTLADGQLHFRDDFIATPFEEDVSGINLTLDHYSTLRDEKTALSLQLQTGRHVTATVDGSLGMNPLTAALTVTSGGISLQSYYPYVEPFLTRPIAGDLSVSAQITYTADGNLTIEQGDIHLAKLVAPFVAKDHFALNDFRVRGIALDLAQQAVVVDSIAFNGGDVRVTRLADGRFSPLTLLKPQPAAQPSAAPAAAPAAEKPWQIRVNAVDLEKFKLDFSDATLPKKPRIMIPELNVHAENLNYPESAQSPFTVALKIGRKGRIKVKGTAAHTPLRLKAQTDIRAFPLTIINDFVPPNLNISLKDGLFFTSLAVAVKQQPDRFSGTFAGKLDITNFDLRDPIGGGELLTWEELNLNGIQGQIAPFSLHIKEVALSDYLTNILITKDGRVNLTSLTAAAEEDGEGGAPAEDKKTAASAEEGSTAAPPDIRIDALTLQGGTVAFIDRHMASVFSTTMYKLGGRVTGLSSAENMQADVDLRGQLENNSPLTINGKINPLSRDLFADITMSFKDIDLTPLTPYSGTYLGYTIDTGKLYLDLSYHIEHRQVKADNKVMIDHLTFGDTVESEQATSLPVTLAVALLQDNNSEIHLDIPVSGDLNDPDFSIGGVVFTVLKNLLIKAATSPFALMSSMLGGDEDFTEITFAPGLTKIDAEQAKKLGSLAEMLAKRPALNLEISGFVDKEKDPEGYRQAQLDGMIVDVKWREMKDAGTAPATKDDVVIAPEEYPDLLLTVYKQADFPRPRNFVGLLKKLPQEEMEKLLLSQVAVEEEQLQSLAKARAMAVREALVAADETIKPRLFLKKTDIYRPPEKGAAARVEFNIETK